MDAHHRSRLNPAGSPAYDKLNPYAPDAPSAFYTGPADVARGRLAVERIYGDRDRRPVGPRTPDLIVVGGGRRIAQARPARVAAARPLIVGNGA